MDASNEPITRREIRPAECALLLAIPTTREASKSVVILIAHWTEQGVELADRITPDDQFIDAVPDRDVIIDLSVCHPMRLARRLRDTRPRAMVRDSERAATVFLWLHFYAIVFQYLHERHGTYVEAFEYAHEQLWRLRG